MILFMNRYILNMSQYVIACPAPLHTVNCLKLSNGCQLLTWGNMRLEVLNYVELEVNGIENLSFEIFLYTSVLCMRQTEGAC